MTDAHRSRIRVAILFGGRSSEHGISCDSALSIIREIDRERFEAIPVFITLDGHWVSPNADPGPDFDAAALEELGKGAAASALSPVRTIADALVLLEGVDVVFPVLHGVLGEDGTVQGLLELAVVPYVGNGVTASAIGIDKQYTKQLLAAAGLDVVEDIIVHDTSEESGAAISARFSPPYFVKPSRGGSSIGTSRVDDPSTWSAAVAEALKHDNKVLVEPAVLGREVDIGVLQFPDGRVEAAPPLEIVLPEGASFFDFHSKYRSAEKVLRVPADLDPELTALLQEQAKAAFRALGCVGMLRVDFLIRETPQGPQPLINEVNTLPGLTAMSQYPQMWLAGGVPFVELLTTLVETALRSDRGEDRVGLSHDG
jgi:D-alanine-D-alanine ligase